MTLIVKPSFKNRVNTLYEQYVEQFISEWNTDGSYEPCVVIGDEEKGTGKYIDSIPEDQIEFIRLYLGHMMLSGDTKEHLKIIEHFLSMQGCINISNRIEIRFLMGNPIEVFVYVDALHEIDLADSYGLTEFKLMRIYNANKKKWTLKGVKEFIRNVKDDFGFDGYEPEISFRYEGCLLEIKYRM